MNEKATILDEIQKRLASHPSLSYEKKFDSITVEPVSEDGFPVSLFIDSDEFMVCLDGWHEHFKSEEEAIACFLFGLSDKARIKAIRRGNFEHHWTLEYLIDDRWLAHSVVGLIFFPFWLKSQVIFRQNSAITEPPAPDADYPF
jgi:hypothetical protein